MYTKSSTFFTKHFCFLLYIEIDFYILRLSNIIQLFNIYNSPNYLIHANTINYVYKIIHIFPLKFYPLYVEIYTHIHLHTCIHICIHIHIHTHIHTHIYTHIYTHIHIYIYIHTYIHTYIYTHKQTYTQIYIKIYTNK